MHPDVEHALSEGFVRHPGPHLAEPDYRLAHTFGDYFRELVLPGPRYRRARRGFRRAYRYGNDAFLSLDCRGPLITYRAEPAQTLDVPLPAGEYDVR